MPFREALALIAQPRDTEEEGAVLNEPPMTAEEVAQRDYLEGVIEEEVESPSFLEIGRAVLGIKAMLGPEVFTAWVAEKHPDWPLEIVDMAARLAEMRA